MRKTGVDSCYWCRNWLAGIHFRVILDLLECVVMKWQDASLPGQNIYSPPSFIYGYYWREISDSESDWLSQNAILISLLSKPRCQLRTYHWIPFDFFSNESRLSSSAFSSDSNPLLCSPLLSCFLLINILLSFKKLFSNHHLLHKNTLSAGLPPKVLLKEHFFWWWFLELLKFPFGI